MSDYVGKSKGLSLNYNKNVKLEFFKVLEGQDDEIIDIYVIDDVESKLKEEMDSNKKEHDRKMKKLESDKNKTSNATEGEEEEKPKAKIPKGKEEELAELLKVPKVKISIEFSRSGYLQITKATLGTKFLNAVQIRKPIQLNTDQLKEAQARLKFYEQRDKDKIKRDVALNDFESMVYKLREWLREEENFPYVKEEEREKKIEELNGHEDWLYEDGADANFTTFQTMYRKIKKDYDKYSKRKEEHEARKTVEEGSDKVFEEFEEKTRDLAETKPWITKEERQDVLDKIQEVKDWLKKELEE